MIAGVGNRLGATEPLTVFVSFSISCSDSTPDSDCDSAHIWISDAGDAELEDGDDSTLIGIWLDDATAFGGICGRGPLGTTEADDDLCTSRFGLGVRDMGSNEATWGGDGERAGEGDRDDDGEGEDDDDEADEERSDGDVEIELQEEPGQVWSNPWPDEAG
jgi:hypothetical protein